MAAGRWRRRTSIVCTIAVTLLMACGSGGLNDHAGGAAGAGTPGLGGNARGVGGAAGVAATGSGGRAPSGGGTGQSVGGTTGSGGSVGSGGAVGTGGMGGSATSVTGGTKSGGIGGLGSGGLGSTGGVKGTGGVAMGGTGGGGIGAGGSTGASTGGCGSTTLNQHPFGCKFAWGIADPGGSLASYSYVQFASYWVDSSISAAGTYTTCNGCSWLTKNVASTNLIPAYYAYIIGFLAHANGIVDGNQTGSKKLTTDGAALVKAHYQAIIDAYAWYAKQTAAAWPTKPLVWLLEGDFVQLADSGQSSPMTYAEVGKLAADITCAIKSNMPNAVVAIDHSSWNSNDVTKSYWGAMKNVNYDMVWTTGVGNNKGFIASGSTSSTYNAATATYSYLHSATGKTILVDTSAGASAAGDSWSSASLADLNARITEGVVAANITGTAPTGLQGNISNLAGLSAFPACP